MRREARSTLLNTSGASDGNPQHQAPVTHLLIILRERPCLTCQRKMRRKHPFCYHQTHNLTYDLACSLCFLLLQGMPFLLSKASLSLGILCSLLSPFPRTVLLHGLFPSYINSFYLLCYSDTHTHTHAHTHTS